METTLKKIGKDKGLVVPEEILEQLKNPKNFIIEVDKENNRLIFNVKMEVREGWDKVMEDCLQKYGQPEVLIVDIFEDEEL